MDVQHIFPSCVFIRFIRLFVWKPQDKWHLEKKTFIKNGHIQNVVRNLRCVKRYLKTYYISNTCTKLHSQFLYYLSLSNRAISKLGEIHLRKYMFVCVSNLFVCVCVKLLPTAKCCVIFFIWTVEDWVRKMKLNILQNIDWSIGRIQ